MLANWLNIKGHQSLTLRLDKSYPLSLGFSPYAIFYMYLISLKWNLFFSLNIWLNGGIHGTWAWYLQGTSHDKLYWSRITWNLKIQKWILFTHLLRKVIKDRLKPLETFLWRYQWSWWHFLAIQRHVDVIMTLLWRHFLL